MTISDSTPIQFWDYSDETFNESQPICGLEAACFCLPYNCNDSIPIQFFDDEFESFDLVIFNSESLEIDSVPFSAIGDGYFALEVTPSDLSPEICEKVKFVLRGSNALQNEDFDTDLSSWENVGTGTSWAWNDDSSDGSALSNTNTGVNSKYLVQDFDVRSDAESLSVDFELNSGEIPPPGDTYFRIYGFNAGVPTELYSILLTNGTQTISGQSLAIGDYDQIGFRLVYDTGFFGCNVHYFRITYRYRAKKSDCIDLRNDHKCTKLIEYTNSSDFDGIKYEISPQPTFYLRVPAQLWKEDNPQTQEDLELSNGVIVTLRQTIQEKTLLELGYMPPYMHKKVQKILMHDTVIIDGIQWKRRDPYESESLKDYPLKTASVLLTKYNSVLKNTI